MRAGADVNAPSENGLTPLMVASRGGHADVVKVLLEAGAADPNLKSENGETALDIAQRTQNSEIADLLRRAGGRSGKSLTLEVK